MQHVSTYTVNHEPDRTVRALYRAHLAAKAVERTAKRAQRETLRAVDLYRVARWPYPVHEYRHDEWRAVLHSIRVWLRTEQPAGAVLSHHGVTVARVGRVRVHVWLGRFHGDPPGPGRVTLDLSADLTSAVDTARALFRFDLTETAWLRDQVNHTIGRVDETLTEPAAWGPGSARLRFDLSRSADVHPSVRAAFDVPRRREVEAAGTQTRGVLPETWLSAAWA